MLCSASQLPPFKHYTPSQASAAALTRFPERFGISASEMREKLSVVTSLVAKPILKEQLDPGPAAIGPDEDILIGSRHHAGNVALLVQLGVSAVLNCAPGGIRSLPLDAYADNGIQYRATNVREDHVKYPILHGDDGVWSQHLCIASGFYDEVRAQNGKLLVFCVAGQNRSATIAMAVLLLRKQRLGDMLTQCAKSRPFVLENMGFAVCLPSLARLEPPHVLPPHPPLYSFVHFSSPTHSSLCLPQPRSIAVAALCYFPSSPSSPSPPSPHPSAS